MIGSIDTGIQERYRRRFTLVTSHRALQWLNCLKDPDGTAARWQQNLAPFDYEVRHRPGKSIGHADSLSRAPTSTNAAAETFQELDPQFCSYNHFPNYSHVVSHGTDHRLDCTAEHPNTDLPSLPANASLLEERKFWVSTERW